MVERRSVCSTGNFKLDLNDSKSLSTMLLLFSSFSHVGKKKNNTEQQKKSYV